MEGMKNLANTISNRKLKKKVLGTKVLKTKIFNIEILRRKSLYLHK